MVGGLGRIALALALGLVVGCGNSGSQSPGAGQASPGGSGSTSGAPASGLTRSADAGGSAAASASAGASAGAGASPAAGSSGVPAGMFINPVLNRSFADPFILHEGDTYYGFATGDLTYNLLVSTSPDLVTWSTPTEALPRLPLWQPSSKGLTWAPEVVKTSAGFVLHYTSRDVQAGKQCLSVAVADAPAGPYVDSSTEPLVCQTDLGGTIDSSPFRDDDGSLWLIFKNDGNCCGLPTKIWAQRLSDDGRSVTGKIHDLGEVNDAVWERGVVEAPTLFHRDGTYFLFYSANAYNTRDYAVGYATSKKLLGPYEDAKENPILSTKAKVGSPPGQPAGPGHQSVIADDDGDLWMAYHAWDIALVGDQVGGTRSLWLDELQINGGKASVKGPDIGPQPIP
jgi:beta-xylosidase